MPDLGEHNNIEQTLREAAGWRAFGERYAEEVERKHRSPAEAEPPLSPEEKFAQAAEDDA